MKWFLSCIIMFISVAGYAADIWVGLSEYQQERANNLYEIIRCPVCDGQSLAGSEATIAKDLRRIIDIKIQNNLSDTQIKHDLIQIYGDDIVFEPPVNKATFLLNYGVYGVLIVILSVFLYRHHHKKQVAQGHSTSHSDSD
jgi:cytochrome c-type biogenesis protein CcmH